MHVGLDEAHELAQRITAAATHELTASFIDTAARRTRRCGVTATDLEAAAREIDDALLDAPLGRLPEGLPQSLAAPVEAARTAARAAITAPAAAILADWRPRRRLVKRSATSPMPPPSTAW